MIAKFDFMRKSLKEQSMNHEKFLEKTNKKFSFVDKQVNIEMSKSLKKLTTDNSDLRKKGKKLEEEQIASLQKLNETQGEEL